MELLFSIWNFQNRSHHIEQIYIFCLEKFLQSSNPNFVSEFISFMYKWSAFVPLHLIDICPKLSIPNLLVFYDLLERNQSIDGIFHFSFLLFFLFLFFLLHRIFLTIFFFKKN